MGITACFLLLTTVPYEPATIDHCETLEINRFYDTEANLVFVQHIFRDGDSSIRDWRLAKEGCSQPYYDSDRSTYRMDWHDGTVFRSVRFFEIRHTYTQHDPELIGREKLPKEYRRELSKPLKRP